MEVGKLAIQHKPSPKLQQFMYWNGVINGGLE